MLLALQAQPDLIDQVHDQLLAAVVDGRLAPGQRLTQDQLAEMLGVSRQPVSHALQILRRRGLFIDHGRRGIAVAPIDGQRIRDLYQVRAALDGLSAELAAARIAAARPDVATPDVARVTAAQAALEAGSAIAADAATPMSRLIDADVAFHASVHQLSGNRAITETIADQWPHFRRSMQLVLASPTMRERVWAEHRGILDAIVAGDVTAAGHLARAHTTRAGEDTARRLDEAGVTMTNDNR